MTVERGTSSKKVEGTVEKLCGKAHSPSVHRPNVS